MWLFIPLYSECGFLQNCLVGSAVSYIYMLKLIGNMFGIMPLTIRIILDLDVTYWVQIEDEYLFGG